MLDEAQRSIVQCREVQHVTVLRPGYQLGGKVSSMARTITIRLSKDDDHLKEKLRELREHKCEGNPYFGLSESFIAKRILDRPLTEEHRRIIQMKPED